LSLFILSVYVRTRLDTRFHSKSFLVAGVVNAAQPAFPIHTNPLYSPRPLSFSKMALDRDESTTDFMKSKESPTLDSKTEPGGNPDLEANGEKSKPGYSRSNKSAGPRIAPVLPHLEAYDFGNDDSGSDILGKQIELDVGSDIKYRTCSWQKVRRHLFH
jgi:hypothetical protein